MDLNHCFQKLSLILIFLNVAHIKEIVLTVIKNVYILCNLLRIEKQKAYFDETLLFLIYLYNTVYIIICIN